RRTSRPSVPSWPSFSLIKERVCSRAPRAEPPGPPQSGWSEASYTQTRSTSWMGSLWVPRASDPVGTTLSTSGAVGSASRKAARLLGVRLAALLPGQPPKVLARAHAAEVAVGELGDVVERLVDRYEPAERLPSRPLMAATNPAELADLARLEAAQTQAPIDVW